MSEPSSTPSPTSRANGRTLRAIAILALLGWWMAMCIATHLPPKHLPTTHVNDKVEHAIAYGGLTTLLWMAIWPWKRRTRVLLLTIVAAVIIYGAIDEITQPFFDRTCDIHDWLADATAAIAISAALALVRAAFSRKTVE